MFYFFQKIHFKFKNVKKQTDYLWFGSILFCFWETPFFNSVSKVFLLTWNTLNCGHSLVVTYFLLRFLLNFSQSPTLRIINLDVLPSYDELFSNPNFKVTRTKNDENLENFDESLENLECALWVMAFHTANNWTFSTDNKKLHHLFFLL